MKRTAIALATAALFVFVLSVTIHAQGKAASITGTWELSMAGRDGNLTTQTIAFEQTGEALKGAMKGQRGDTPLEGTVKGNSISFTVKRQTPNGEISQTYNGTVEGDSMKGTVAVGQNTRDWTAKKK